MLRHFQMFIDYPKMIEMQAKQSYHLNKTGKKQKKSINTETSPKIKTLRFGKK